MSNRNYEIKKKITEDFWIKKLSGVKHSGFNTSSGEHQVLSQKICMDEDLYIQICSITKGNLLAEYTCYLTTYLILLEKYFGFSPIVVTPKIKNTHEHPECPKGFLYFKMPSFCGYTLQESIKLVQAEVQESVKMQSIDIESINELKAMSTPIFGFNFSGVNLINTNENKRLPIQFGVQKIDVATVLFTLTYDTALIDKHLFDNFLKHFLNILEQFKEGSFNVKIEEIDYLTKAENDFLLKEINTVQLPDLATIDTIFEQQVQQTPNAVALQFENQSWTYQQIDDEANKLAHYLKTTYQLKKEEIIGVMAERSERMIIALLGIVKAGGAYLPIDPYYPEQRKQYILTDSNVQLLLTDSDYMFGIGDFQGELFVMDIQLESLEKPTESISKNHDGSNLAYVIYTSGSTGNPKGVMVEHQGHINMSLDQIKIFGVNNHDKVLQFASFSFDASISEIGMAFYTGATLVLIKKDTIADINLFTDYAKNQGVTIVTLPPVYLSRIKPDSLDFLRAIITAGEPAQLEEVKIYGQKMEYYNAYGPTEYSVCASVFRVEDTENLENNIPIGKPIANTSILIVDENLRLLPRGVKGEIVLTGLGLARGYLNQENLTNEKFVENPYESGKRLYRTGDIGKWDAQGNLVFVGRTDNQVKIRGFRIEIGEIENTILRHEKIANASVLVVENQQEKQLNLYIESSQLIDNEDINMFLEEYLPHYMIPAEIYILPELPLTVNGKIDTKALLVIGKDQIIQNAKNNVEPRNDVDKKLIEIWKEILGKQSLSINDNFFQIGGHSLKAIQMISKVELDLGIKVGVNDIFHQPILKDFSDFMVNCESFLLKSIPKIVQQEHYALSNAQKRLWFIDQLEDEQNAYTLIGVQKLVGKLNIKALEKTFQTVVERHESLRTVFVNINGEPRQKVLTFEESNFTIKKHDLTTSTNPDDLARNMIEQSLKERFNLQDGPLFRVSFFQLSDTEFVMFCAMHHIISDGWSIKILQEEVKLCYNAAINNLSNPLPALGIQFKDFSAWQNDLLLDNSMDEHKNYWQQQLQGELPILELPTDFARPVTKTFSSKAKSFKLNPKSWKQLKQVSDEKEASRFMTLLASVNALLHRYTGQQDIIVGSPVAGREHIDLSGQIGFYLNLLALRTKLEGNETFESLLEKVKDTAIGAFTHQIYPFDRLVEGLHLERDISRSALFDVLVVSSSFDITSDISNNESKHFNELKTVDFPINFSANKYDLTFYFTEKEDGLEITIAYNVDLFSEAKIALMTTHFQTLIGQLLNNIQVPICQHDYLSNDEKESILIDFNNTIKPYDKTKTLHQIFEQQVEKTPKNQAVRHNGESLSYHELNQKANQLANFLLEKGVKNGDNVGLISSRGFDMIIGMFGILKSGAAYVPIDPEYPLDRQEYIIDNSGIKLVITDNNYPVANQSDTGFVFLNISTENLDNYSPENLPLSKPSDELAYIIYTSGSTGKPKGVMIEHHSAVNLVAWVNNTFSVGIKDKILCVTSMCFDLSVYDIFGALSTGATLVMVGQEEIKDVELLSYIIQNEGITFWNSVPSTMNLLVSEIERMDAFQNNSLRVVFMSGDWIPVHLPNKIKQFFPNAAIISLGGATEGTVWSNYYPITQTEAHWTSIPYGKPIDNNFFYILDSYLNPVPVGVVGELYIGGVGVARGYKNDAEKTVNAFIPDPFNTNLGGMMYKTGDLGRMMPDNNMEFMGRRDQQVKIRGYRVELGEIESNLIAHPAIQSALVTVVGKDASKQILAYYISNEPMETATLKTFLAQTLPPYMIPVAFIPLTYFPMNSNGKIDRKALPLPSNREENDAKSYKLPITDTEVRLLDIWKEVLSKEQISMDDNFFEIGGHSLLATQIATKIQANFRINLKLRSLFMNPSIEDLAAEIDAVNWLNHNNQEEYKTENLNQFVL